MLVARPARVTGLPPDVTAPGLSMSSSSRTTPTRGGATAPGGSSGRPLRERRRIARLLVDLSDPANAVHQDFAWSQLLTLPYPRTD